MKKITVSFPDGTTETLPSGIHAADVAQRLGAEGKTIVAVLVNNELSSLYASIDVNCRIQPVTLDSPAGALVLRRSLCFLLAMAAREIFPERTVVVGHSLSNGYYHSFDDELPLTEDDIKRIEARMRSIVAEDQAIKRSVMSYEDALHHFEASGQDDTLLLLKQMNSPRIPVNVCRGFMDLFIAPLAPSTGIMRKFELYPYADGFLLRYPSAARPDEIGPFRDNPLLLKIYREYKRWGKTLGVTSVGAINSINKPATIRPFIRTAEALQNKKIAEIADMIAEREGKVRAVLVAGPSSSGKTTFAKKLSIQLTVLGMVPVPISLDDYFVDRTRTPRDAKGEPDYECLEALDLEYLNAQLVDLLAGKEVELPIFDFKTGNRSAGRKLRLTGREVLILEGIHGLNDKLTHRIPAEQKFKVYVSALTQLNLDDHNRIPTTDNRLVRRIVRDYQFRGRSAEDTLKMWPSVMRGEKLYIFPFQNQADAAFNSALDYELSVLSIYAEPLLKEVKTFSPEYAEASRLLSFLEYFTPLPPSHVPRDSILREFIGESEFKY